MIVSARFRPAYLAPEDVPVVAIIEDPASWRFPQYRCRALWLKRVGAVWWLPDDSKYTFYRPSIYLHLERDGYPWLNPCPRCGYRESCDCTVLERACVAHPGLMTRRDSTSNTGGEV